jgi:hypothetical protein
MTGHSRRRERTRAHRVGLIVSVAGVAALLGTGTLGIILLNTPPSGTLPAGTSAVSSSARIQEAADAAFPAGFWSGTDSTGITIPGPAPYREPAIGGAYGGYIGMAGNWATWQHCGTKVVWSGADSGAADVDYNHHHEGIGTGVYWFMGGPGVDPHYNGTAKEASAWGAAQAARTLSDIRGEKTPVTYPVVFMDIELPGVAPALDNGWDNVYTSPCSGTIRHRGMPVKLDRAEFNGFLGYLTSHSAYQAGVYSAPDIWTQIFGTGAAASIPNTYEWTYEPETANLADAPPGWCLASGAGCAEFFGGVTRSSRYALMWQWSGGGGVRNAIGDFDQINARGLSQ